MFSRLNNKIKKLLFSHGIFLFARSSFQVFMSVFVWRLTNDISVVAWFNIIFLILHTTIFFVLNETFRKGQIHKVRKIGLIGFSLVYLSLFIFQENVQNFLYLYAFVIGIFNGMYWFSYQFNRFNSTHIKNRNSYTGLERAIDTIVGFIAPVVGGYIISSDHFFSGYPSLFLLGAIFFILAMIMGNINVSSNNNLKKVDWKKLVTNVFSKPKVLKIFLANMLGGFSLDGSLIRVVLPFLILQKTGTEFQLGGWLSLFALLSILTSLSLGHWISYLHFDRSIFIGGLIFVILFLLLYFFPVFGIFILFGAVQDVAANMIDVPRRVYTENLLHTLPNFEENKTGYLAVREVFGVGIGRVSSFVVLLFINDFSSKSLSFYAILIIIGVVAQISMLLSIKYKDEKFDLSSEISA